MIAGGGAAGFFASISAAESNPHAQVVLLEKTTHLLSKVRISGGSRCNVTHACFDPRELSTRYPRGGRALIGPLTRFGPTETVNWFQSRGVKLKTESDGRMFPTTDSSQTIIDCLTQASQKAKVKILTEHGVQSLQRSPDGGFTLRLTSGSTMESDRFLWAAGGCRPESHPCTALGHTLSPPIPSLFTFHIDLPWLNELAGLSLDSVEVSVPETDLRESGPLLITHSGLSGPAILRLSAWGARPSIPSTIIFRYSSTGFLTHRPTRFSVKFKTAGKRSEPRWFFARNGLPSQFDSGSNWLFWQELLPKIVGLNSAANRPPVSSRSSPPHNFGSPEKV